MSSPNAGQRAAFLDAVCCIQFHSAGKTGLLLKLLRSLEWEIHVPHEVDEEVRRGRTATALAQWNRLVANDAVTVLPRLDTAPTTDPDVQRVRQLFAEARGLALQLALTAQQHKGEAAVIAYARLFEEHSRAVVVLIDDHEAATQAADVFGLTVISMEDLLYYGYQLGIAELNTKAKVRAVYETLEPHGGSLVSWGQCDLRLRLR